MVAGLDGRYRIEANALVGAVKTLVVHANPDERTSRSRRTGRQPARGSAARVMAETS